MINTRTRQLALILVLAFFGFSAAHADGGRAEPTAENATKPVVVFAAASLKTALDRIASAWKKASGKNLTRSYAASSALAKQIEAGAPADVYLSADLRWMDWLAARELIDETTRKNLLGNALVLIAPKTSDIALEIAPDFELAQALGDGPLAMGEPNAVPAGTYAKAALETLGVWKTVEPKIAGAENVRVALAYVARGETPLGIVYATDAKSEPNVRIIGTFPAETHPPIVYPVARTATSKNPEAKTFMDFLGSPEARTIYEDEGFTVLE